MTVGDEFSQCWSKNKEKIDDVGIIEHGRYWNQATNRNHFSEKMSKSWRMDVAKFDNDAVSLPPETKK